MTGTLIAETNATGQVQKEYIWNDMEPVAQVDNEITYLHSDHLYTPRRGTDDLQTTVWQWESNAFGSTNPQIETTEVNLRFLGQYQDEETDLHYNWNRYYDAGIGWYVTSDPIGLAGGLNTYGYVGANPLIYYDDEGLSRRGGGRKNARIDCKLRDLRSRKQSLEVRLKHLRKKGKERTDILEGVAEIIEEINELEKMFNDHLPLKCVERKCPWDPEKPQNMCEAPQPSLSPERTPANGCKCVDWQAAWI